MMILFKNFYLIVVVNFIVKRNLLSLFVVLNLVMINDQPVEKLKEGI